MATVFLLFCVASWSLACRPAGDWHSPLETDRNNSEFIKKVSLDKIYKGKGYFSADNTWGGWSPNKGDESWKYWIAEWSKHRTTEIPESEEWKTKRGPKSGWPQSWKGIGLGIDGVPPPPWSVVKEAIDKPHFCFYRPEFGHCSGRTTRWAFDPSKNKCVTFTYSNCGGNANNFWTYEDCNKACVKPVATDCVNEPEFNLEDALIGPGDMPSITTENHEGKKPKYVSDEFK